MLKDVRLGAALATFAMVCPVVAEHSPPQELAARAPLIVAEKRCTEAPIEVIAISAAETHLVCDAADHALQLLARCHITPRRPFGIEIVQEVRRPFGGKIFGLFDPRQEKVLATRYENVAALMGGTPYAEVPPREFYKSLVVHEVIHAVLHQNYKRPPGSHAAYEYPAYALQIESLPSDVRDRLLRTIGVVADEHKVAFNDSLLSFDPFFFAARAYEHFKSSANGCAHLLTLIEGEAAFIWTRPLQR